MTKDYEAVHQVISQYLDGLYDADSTQLRAVFHPGARYLNTVEGDEICLSVDEYLQLVDQRVPPSQTKDIRVENILSVEFGSDTMAFVKLQMQMFDRRYTDFLTFVRWEGTWVIASKVFSYYLLERKE